MGSLDTDFEEVLKKSTGKASGVVPGCVLQAVNSSGDLFYHKAVGDAGVQKDAKPLKEDGTFWIASCTKLIASICALQQVEQGKVDLDEDITRIIPELQDLPIIVEDKTSPSGYSLKKRTKTITLRHLLSHTSGVGYEFMSPLIHAWRQREGPSYESITGTVLKAYSTPLLHEPGEGWVYGAGIDFAGIMVERLTGKTLGAYMDEVIFKPLGLTSTTFHVDQSPDILSRLMPASRREENGSLSLSDTNGFPQKMLEHSGGGGLWGSAPDYIKVLADLISPQPKLLKPETIDNVLAAPQMADGSPALENLVGARGAVAANAAEVTAAPPINYGCGGMVTTGDTPVLPAGSLSWGGLPNLKWFLNRKLGVAAMFATQILPHGDALATDLSSHFFVEVLRLHKTK